MSNSKYKKVRARRESRMPIINALGELGISLDEVANVVGVSVASVSNYRRLLKERGELNEAPSGDECFAVQFRRYVELNSKECSLDDCEKAVFGALEHVLCVSDAMHRIAGAIHATRAFAVMGTRNREWAKSIPFFDAVFGKSHDGHSSPDWIWSEYILNGINSKDVPDGYTWPEMTADAVRWVVLESTFASSATNAQLYWDVDPMPYIQTALKTLPARDALVIECYVLKGMTLSAVGNELGVSVERVRQFKEKALRKLRQSPCVDMLELFVNSTTSVSVRLAAAQELSDLRKQVVDFGTHLRQREAELAWNPVMFRDNLLLRIDGLQLSTRLVNCLERAEITHLGELAFYASKPTLLKLKNFGRKCLNEITWVLEDLGLELGESEVCSSEREFFESWMTENGHEVTKLC